MAVHTDGGPTAPTLDADVSTDPTVAAADIPGGSVRIDTGEVDLHALLATPDDLEEGGEADDEDAPLAVLLHGFPECWYGWHRQVRPLVEAGYRVLVPDQRGYNRSGKPRGVRAYRLARLAADVVGMADALDAGRVHLAGHDWGAAVAWWTALHHPERLRSLTAVNVPHPTVMYDRLRTDWGQRLRSWYFLPFQVPVLPETVARLGDWASVVRGMRDSSNPGTFTEHDFAQYRRAWNRPRAFTSMLNWYRAVARERPRPADDRVRVPTTVLWGENDQFLKREMASESVAYCEDGRLERVPNATHWVQHERPALVAETLVETFAEAED
jgi:pimeloyl-ACP methyl ester carboxylesterase